MTTYYADFDLTTGGNNGSDDINAWQSMDDIISGAPSAGDTVLCKGTDSISSQVAWTISGSSSGGHIKLIGVDSSWDNVGGGTRAVIDAQGNSFIALLLSQDYFWLENFEIKNAGSSGTSYHGISFSTSGYSDYNVFVNIYSRDNYGNGLDGAGGYSRYTMVLMCRVSGNSGKGFRALKNATIAYCRADNNTGIGFDLTASCLVRGCISHGNSIGFYFYHTDAYNGGGNVAHDNTNEGFKYYQSQVVLETRSTSNGTGLGNAGGQRLPAFYYYGDNTTETSGLYDDLGNGGVSTVTLNGTDTDEGYEDSANDDFNLADDATYRRVAVEIP